MTFLNPIRRLLPKELRIWHKLFLVGLVFALPIGALLYFMLAEQQKPIDFARKEQSGMSYLRPCRQMLEHVLHHRLLVNLQKANTQVNASELAETRQKITGDFQALDAVQAKYGQELSQQERTTEQYVSALKQKWQGAQRASLTAKESDELHMTMVKDLRALIALVGDTSNLILDPDLDSYYAMDAVLIKLPEGQDLLGQLINDGEEIIGRQALTPNEKTQLVVQTGLVKSLFTALNSPYNGLPVAYKKDNDSTSGQVLETLLAPSLSNTVVSTEDLNDQLQNQVINSPMVGLSSREFTEQGSRALAASFALWDESAKALDLLLTARIDRFRTNQYSTLIFCAAAVGLAVLLMSIIIRGITRQTNALMAVFTQLGIGNFEARAEVTSSDELGQMAETLNTYLLPLVHSQEDRLRLQTSIQKLLEEVAGVAEGDLTKEAEVSADEMGAIADSFNYMLEQLRKIIGNVQDATLDVTSSATQIQATAEHLAHGSENQAEQIVSTSTAISEMAASIQQVSENAQGASGVAKEALTNALKGREAVSNTIQGMNRIRDQVQETAKRIKRLGESSQEIGQIIQLIDDIADRTSILALNASIQAAAAGEAGRGFAVVAAEVERLAERSTEATKKIGTLVKTIQGETNEAVAAMEKGINEVVDGSKLANQAGKALDEIEGVSNQLAELIQSISLAANQQARGSEAVSKSMNDISSITQQTAAGTRQAAESVSQLAGLAESLRSSVSTFRLPGRSGHTNGKGNGHTNGNGHSNGNGHGSGLGGRMRELASRN